MKILHVITRLELGGAQQNTLHTCRELAARGHEVVLVSGVGGMLDEEARRGPFRFVPIDSLVREVRPLRDLRALAALVRLVRSFRPDVTHTHSSKAGALGRWAAWLGGCRAIVHSVHGWSFAEGMPAAARLVYSAVERASAPVTSHFVCVSRRDLETGIRLGIISAGKGSVIRSGFDLSRFRADGPGRDAVRREWGVADDDVLVVDISNFKPQKAPLDFVQAAGRAAREEPRLRFAFVGDGELRSEVEAKVDEEDLRGRMVLAGWRRDVAEILRAADVVALTSRWEGLPRTVVQARACARPVVATAVNGTPEVVAHDVTGILVPPGDIVALGDAFVRLARDRALRRHMGEKATAGLEEFDEGLMVDQQESLYRTLVDPARTPPIR